MKVTSTLRKLTERVFESPRTACMWLKRFVGERGFETLDGKVFFGPDHVTLDQLLPLIQERLRRGADRRAYLVMDSRTRYGNAKEVIEAVRSAGIEDVSFVAQQSH